MRTHHIDVLPIAKVTEAKHQINGILRSIQIFILSDLDAIQALSALILSSHCDTKRHCVYALRNLSYEPSREIKVS